MVLSCGLEVLKWSCQIATPLRLASRPSPRFAASYDPLERLSGGPQLLTAVYLREMCAVPDGESIPDISNRDERGQTGWKTSPEWSPWL